MSYKLTVLVEEHNGGTFLHTSMDSILQQTYHDFTFLVVDDAFSDDTCDSALIPGE